MTAPFILALSLLTSPLNENVNTNPNNPVETKKENKTLTISWEDKEIDELELRSEYNIMIPSIMTEGSMQIHLNYLIDFWQEFELLSLILQVLLLMHYLLLFQA